MKAYHTLYKAFGPQDWWPGETAFEILVGAILTQNTSWKNVELAIRRLRESNALDPNVIHEMDHDDLAELIRPAGYYRLKARRLKNAVHLICHTHGGSLDSLFSQSKVQLREELLSVNGVGPETADSIVLYAAELPVFVVDTYTARVLKRHGWIDLDADYHAIQDAFESQLEENTQLYNEYHALLVRVGSRYCKRTPKCDECPLYHMLPDEGPIDLDS